MKFSIARTLVLAAGGIGAVVSAQAQSVVTIYGVADAYIQYGRAGGITSYKLESGGESGSRLGFRGQEDLGGGLKALFLLETGVAEDTGGVTQGGVFWGRQVYAGLDSRSVGTVTLGRQYNLNFVAVDYADPFGTGLGSVYISGIMSAVGGSRVNNSAVYQSPAFGPVTLSVLGALGEGSTGKLYSTNVKYLGGPLSFVANYTHKDGFGLQSQTASSGLLGASYDFGAVKLMAEVQTVKNLTQLAGVNDNRSEYFIGAQVPFGPHRITAVVGQGKTKDVSNTKASEFSIGYQYSLSKRTDLYAVASLINNGSATAYTANGATGLGPITTAGQDVRAAQFGIRHRF